MPVRWSPLKVSQAIDRVEAQLNAAHKPLERAQKEALKALETPALPEYMKYEIRSLADSLRASVSRISYEIERVRRDLPKDQLTKEKQDQAERAALVLDC